MKIKTSELKEELIVKTKNNIDIVEGFKIFTDE